MKAYSLDEALAYAKFLEDGHSPAKHDIETHKLIRQLVQRVQDAETAKKRVVRKATKAPS